MSAIHPLTEKGDLELVVLLGGHGAENTLRLRCHQTILRLASPLLDDLLECSAPETPGDDNSSAAAGEIRRQLQLPTLRVDGSATAWTEILAHLYSGFSPPPLPSPRPAAVPDLQQQAGSNASGAVAAAREGSKASGAAAGEFSWSSAREMLPVLHQVLRH